MNNGRESRRNWRAAIVLGIALAMLALGLTVFSPYLRGLGYILYWLICIVFTLLAFFFALGELRGLRERSREEQRALIEHALEGLPETRSERTRSTPNDPNSSGA